MFWQVFKRHFLFVLLSLFMANRVYVFCEGDVFSCEDNFSYGSSYAGEGVASVFTVFRVKIAQNVRKYLPSPHSELVLGMTLGVDDFRYLPRFNDVLRETGTIHVVVVSGYNISLVFGLILSIIGSQYKLRNLIIAQIGTFFYAVSSGFDPPVIRSWIMGSILAWGKFYGRSINALRVLVFSGLVMVAINPSFLFSLSFQLSFLATLSLVLYSEPVEGVLAHCIYRKGVKRPVFTKNILCEDLVATLAAQVLVWPLLSYKFGEVSIISPLVNALILWTVPLATILGGGFILATFIHPVLALLFRWLVYVPLDIFVLAVRGFSKIPFASVDFELSTRLFVVYYAVVFYFSWLKRRKEVAVLKVPR